MCQLRFLMYVVKTSGICSMQSVSSEVTNFVANVLHSHFQTWSYKPSSAQPSLLHYVAHRQIQTSNLKDVPYWVSRYWKAESASACQAIPSQLHIITSVRLLLQHPPYQSPVKAVGVHSTHWHPPHTKPVTFTYLLTPCSRVPLEKLTGFCS